MQDLTRRLRTAKAVTVLTGAGVSAASGVPTFRGTSGWWKDFRPEQLATPTAFARDPETVWEWYDWRRRLCAEAKPNPAHEILAKWEARFPRFTLVTQNVDGLHERAGSTLLIRYHGSIWHLQCSARCPKAPDEWEDLRAPLPQLPPPCPYCGALARPGVVWFGEPIPPDVQAAASRAAATCDVFITVGTSAVVYPAAGLLHEAALQGAYTAEINTEATEATTSVDAALQGSAEELLPLIDQAIGQRREA